MATYPTAPEQAASSGRPSTAPPLGVLFVHPPLSCCPNESLPDGRVLATRPTVPAVPFARGLTKLGRSAACGLRLPEGPGSRTSRLHAEVRREGDSYTIRDLSSRHGTWLNGRRLRNDEQRLVAGDLLRIGDQVGVVVSIREDEALLCELPGGFVVGPTLWAALAPLRAVAATRDGVLIQGETGTGKEHVAKLVHVWSGRSGRYVRRNCAALPAQLADSELFGWQRGAFTGAERSREGYFKAAHRGTLLLDEVDALESALQAKLLRAVQFGEIVELGSRDAEAVDVRVVAATQKDLALEHARGLFRPDLYYRLATHVVELPPLRSRREDIPLLFRRLFAANGAAEPNLALEPEFVERLCLDPWPGNVRDLQSFAARARAALSAAAPFTRADFDALRGGVPSCSAEEPAARAKRAALPGLARERDRIVEVAARGGNLAELARELDVSKDTLYRFLNRHAPGWRSTRAHRGPRTASGAGVE